MSEASLWRAVNATNAIGADNAMPAGANETGAFASVTAVGWKPQGRELRESPGFSRQSPCLSQQCLAAFTG